MNRIYLDNAATSWPKPEVVYQAIERYQREVGVAAGRGSYRNAEAVDRTITQLRSNLNKLIGGVGSPSQCVFTQNCTEALNLALHGLLRKGDTVVTTQVEHNSIVRPLASLEASLGLQTTTVAVDDNGVIDLDQFADAVRADVRLVAITHASNVTGAIQPIAELSHIAKEHNCLLLVDAAQTLGHLPINVERDQIDLLAAPGHKGLLGPLGTGFLYMRPGLEHDLEERYQGGTGTKSELAKQPQELPSKYESGNANVPGLVGLDASVKFVLEQQTSENTLLSDLSTLATEGLASLPGVTVFSQANPCGIVSFNIDGFDPREVATMLDSSVGIEVRAGLHCAPGAHQHLGTSLIGGCVRASFGNFSTNTCAQTLIETISMLANT